MTRIVTCLRYVAAVFVTHSHSAAVGKGRDHLWTGAVDGLRINKHACDFEADGVEARRVG
jgi:hypothetical protein